MINSRILLIFTPLFLSVSLFLLLYPCSSLNYVFFIFFYLLYCALSFYLSYLILNSFSLSFSLSFPLSLSLSFPLSLFLSVSCFLPIFSLSLFSLSLSLSSFSYPLACVVVAIRCRRRCSPMQIVRLSSCSVAVAGGSVELVWAGAFIQD